MRTAKLVVLLSHAALLIGVAAPAAAQEPRRGIAPEQIRAHLAFLADDLLEGRAPGTRGERIAAHYIASQLARSGVEPLRGSYLRPVPLTGWTPDVRRTSIAATTATNRLTLRYPADAVIWLDPHADSASVSAELVFVGYGVRAPEYQWDDYKDRDVRGKVVLVLIGDPPAPPGQPLIFEGPATTYYGRWTYKVEEAARRGAAAVLLVHNADGAGYPWRVVETSWTREQLSLASADTTPPPPRLHGWITSDAARRLLALDHIDFSEVFVRAARRDFQPVFADVNVHLHAAGRTRHFNGTNVVGVITGRHPTRRAEAVVYTAHYDHLGISTAVAGDSIYNGAYDNASGVALLLEIADAFASLPVAPERSIVFLFTTAEEAGLLGAKHYVQNPAIPIARTVAALNIDGANLWGETEDIGAAGLERSTLGVTFETHAAALGLRVHGERAPDKGFFFRSDQFAFARAGVPAIAFDHGIVFRNRPDGWGETTLARYESERYHQPNDEYDPAFDLAGAAQQGRLAFLIGYDVANTAQPPRWYRGGAVVPAAAVRPLESRR